MIFFKSYYSLYSKVNYNKLNLTNNKIIENIHKRGCVIIRDVFEDTFIENLNIQLEKYYF